MALHRVMRGPLNLHGHVHCIADELESEMVIRLGCHSHEAWEVFCPLRGDFQFEFGEGVQTYPEGSLLLVSPGCLHISVNLLAQPPEHELMVLNLSGEVAKHGMLRVTDAEGTFRSTFSELQLQRWAELLGDSPEKLMRLAADAVEEESPWHEERAVALLRLLFSSLGVMVCEEVEKPMPASRGEEVVKETLALLETRYYDVDLTVRGIAETLLVSESHLTALFHRLTGQTLRRTLIDTRLRHAARLLAETSRPIKEIAALTGWQNQLYFSNAFHKRYGLAPSKAREHGDWMGRLTETNGEAAEE